MSFSLLEVGKTFDTKGIIITVIILTALIAFLAYKVLKTKGKDQAKEDAIKFLETLSDKFEAIILKYLKNISFNDLDNLSEIEQKILDDTIDALWTMVQEELAKYAASDSTKELIKIVLNRDFLVSFVKKFIENDNKVQQVYSLKYYEAAVAAQAKAEEFEKETVKQNEEYANEDPSKVEKATPIDPSLNYDFSEGTRENPGKVIEKELNPQPDITEEELEYSTEDSSVEVLEDEKKKE